jgi:ubiquinone biosynthesis protein
VIEELSKLQDAVPPARYEEVARLFVESLGAPPEQLFADFERTPLAAASIAQVHQARLPGGEQVVVKVQRPGIRPLVEQDMDILLMMARAAEARTGWGRRLQLVDLAERFAEVMREELDFRVEAGNLQAVCASLEPGSPIRIPVVYPHLSNDQVLVIEWIDGVNVKEANRRGSLTPGSRRELARSLFRSLAQQIFFGSAFHADPHPGNVLVLPSNQLVLIDFGLVGRLNTLQQTAMREMLVALERRDPAALRDALLEIAELPSAALRAERDLEQLERALAQLLARRLGVGMATNAALFTDLFRILLDFGLSMPGEIGGVFRAMVTLEGTLRLLAPDFQLMEETRALAADWLHESLTPASMQQSLQEELTSLMPVLQRLPRRMERIAASIEHGTLTTNIRLFAHPDEARFVSRLVSRTVMAFLSAAVGLMAVMLLRTPGGGQLSDTLTVFQAFGYAGLVISAALMLRVLAGITRDSL